MGGKKRHSIQIQSNQECETDAKITSKEKRFVNLLHTYSIYKQRFRRLSKEEFIHLIQGGRKNRQLPFDLCKSLMKAKQIPDIVDFEKNVGYLSVPRLMPLIALLAERSGYKLKPSLVKWVDFTRTPQRFQDKFAQLLVNGFWFLGRLISDSLSSDNQINRGNVFNFCKGDLGFWWAGVRILDWIRFINKTNVEKMRRGCRVFVIQDPPKYRMFTNRAITNMNNHPLYFLTDLDWRNYTATISTIIHKKGPKPQLEVKDIDEIPSSDEYKSDCNGSDTSDLLSQLSVNTLASRESVD